MDRTYAAGRVRKPALRFRFRVRATLAVQAYREIAGSRPSHRVLDLGAAEGATLLEMRALLGGLGRFDGVEFSDELIESAPPLPSDTALYRGDITAELPSVLPRASYDLCTLLAVLEHLEDPGAALRNAFDMLRPGGVLVASCPNPVWDEIAGRLRLVADEHHEQHLDAGRMLELARDAGFAGARYRPFMWAPTGILAYAGVLLTAPAALAIDAWIARAPGTGKSFVNQAVVAHKPLAASG
jgi:SAM-dependent methyltransferase